MTRSASIFFLFLKIISIFKLGIIIAVLRGACPSSLLITLVIHLSVIRDDLGFLGMYS